MRNISVAIAAVLIPFAALAQAARQTQDPTKPKGQEPKPAAAEATAPAPAGPKTYVGSEACQACHEDISNAFQKGPHKAVDSDRKHGRENHACEGCHGPASSHVETASAEEIVNPAKLSAARIDETCLACHRNQPTHIGRIQAVTPEAAWPARVVTACINRNPGTLWSERRKRSISSA
jgi:hypothetical protein